MLNRLDSYEKQWNQYKIVRLQSLLGCFAAAYIGRLPYDLSSLAAALFGQNIPATVVSNLTWAMFPIAAWILAWSWTRWAWWSCPRCSGPFFATGRRFMARVLVVNPFASQCGVCALKKWAHTTAIDQRSEAMSV
jgi:hypothetical protein